MFRSLFARFCTGVFEKGEFQGLLDPYSICAMSSCMINNIAMPDDFELAQIHIHATWTGLLGYNKFEIYPPRV